MTDSERGTPHGVCECKCACCDEMNFRQFLLNVDHMRARTAAHRATEERERLLVENLDTAKLLARVEELYAAAKAIEPWVDDALRAYEGHPQPSENEGKRLHVALLDALEKKR